MELASLISTAENLKIKGLAEPEKPIDKHSNAANKRLASPPRLVQTQTAAGQLQQTLNSSNVGTIHHASPMYLQSTPSGAKRKRVEYGSYGAAAAYLGAAAAGNTILRGDKDEVKGSILAAACNSAGGSVVVDVNSTATAAAHRLVESVVSNTGGGPGGGGAPQSQVLLVPVADDHITGGELVAAGYNSSSHHGGLATSDTVLYSVAGAQIYVSRVGGAAGEDGATAGAIVPGTREVMYTTSGEHYASSDDGGPIAPSSDNQHEVNMVSMLHLGCNVFAYAYVHRYSYEGETCYCNKYLFV